MREGEEIMASKEEVRVTQKRLLTTLMMVQKGHDPIDKAVMEATAEMEAEDVSYVEKIVNEYEMKIKKP